MGELDSKTSILVIAIKNMSIGNAETGEAWQETKIFKLTDTLGEVMKWVGTRKRRVVLTVPENDNEEFVQYLRDCGE